MAFKGQSFFIKWKLGSKWPHDLNLVKVWWVAAEKIEPKAESCFEGHRPWNEFFWTFFSNSCNFENGLSECMEKFSNKGQKVAHLAFIWPFWPWKYTHLQWWTETVVHSKFQPNQTSGAKVAKRTTQEITRFYSWFNTAPSEIL